MKIIRWAPVYLFFAVLAWDTILGGMEPMDSLMYLVLASTLVALGLAQWRDHDVYHFRDSSGPDGAV